MTTSKLLNFKWAPSLRLVLQTEASECGLACLCMIAGFFGNYVDMRSTRMLYQTSLKGANLSQLIKTAKKMKLGARPLRLELEDLEQLVLPCILHWNHNHYVVLSKISPKHVEIFNPASGIRNIGYDELSRSFTGVALELWPDNGFEKSPLSPPVKLRSLMGKVTGLSRSFSQILLLALALEIFSLLTPLFLQFTVDNVVVAGDHSLLLTLAIAFSGVLLVQQVTIAIRSYVILYMGTILSVQWRANIFTHLMSLPIQYFEKRHIGDIVSRFGSVDQIQRILTTSFLEAIVDGVMTLLTIGVMFLYSPLLSAISLVAMLFYGVARAIRYLPLKEAMQEVIVHSAKQQSHFLETIRGAKTIKLYQRQDDRKSAWLATLVDAINADIRGQKMQIAYRFFNGSLFGFETIIIIAMAGTMIIDGKMTIGLLTAFISYKGQFDSRVGSLIDKYFDVKMLQLQADRLADIVQSEPENIFNNIESEELSNLEASVKVKNVSFRYSDGEPIILQDVSFDISAGESVAITGPSGCGKTTLLNIVLGILNPTTGDILFGDRSARQIGTGALRSIISTVLQDDVLFAGSIGDNISFFDTDPDIEWIKECARKAFIAEDLESMPMKYNTLVGDMGTVLSGGQKQRVLIARALYRRPKILILDEATSHLDIDRESQVNDAIRNLKITRIIVAHRPETIASADRQIILK